MIFFLFQLQTREAENDAQQKRLTNLVIENPFIVLHCVLQRLAVLVIIPLCICQFICYICTSTLHIVGTRLKWWEVCVSMIYAMLGFRGYFGDLTITGIFLVIENTLAALGSLLQFHTSFLAQVIGLYIYAHDPCKSFCSCYN